MGQEERRIYLINKLLAENPEYQGIDIPADEYQQKRLLRGLMNLREPKPIDREFLDVQDAYLQEELQKEGIVTVNDINFHDGIGIWKGDITRLAADAIVNAANSGMTGCYIPNHTCIDNPILN